MIKRCCDCGWYVPGGCEKNCSFPYPKRQFSDASVCALKEACENYKEKDEADDLSAYPKIDLRPKKRWKRN
jgi:hypothetical protein